MREILFRGKNFDGNWVEGDLVQGKDYGGERMCYIMKSVTCLIFDDYSYDEVDPDTVSEFTGAHDKNGKKIFENDILKIKSWVKGDFLNGALIREDCALVQYDTKTGGYRLKVYNNGNYKRISKFTKNHLFAYDAEVIGNKWDNPELLEKCRT